MPPPRLGRSEYGMRMSPSRWTWPCSLTCTKRHIVENLPAPEGNDPKLQRISLRCIRSPLGRAQGGPYARTVMLDWEFTGAMTLCRRPGCSWFYGGAPDEWAAGAAIGVHRLYGCPQPKRHY
jgi:hypothetical protein